MLRVGIHTGLYSHGNRWNEIKVGRVSASVTQQINHQTRQTRVFLCQNPQPVEMTRRGAGCISPRFPLTGPRQHAANQHRNRATGRRADNAGRNARANRRDTRRRYRARRHHYQPHQNR